MNRGHVKSDIDWVGGGLDDLHLITIKKKLHTLIEYSTLVTNVVK